MVDQIAKKFGVTSTNSISSGATGASPKSGLHESLYKFLDKGWEGMTAWLLQSAMASVGVGKNKHWQIDRIPSTTPGADPPRDAKDSGSARSHSTHLEASSSYRP